MATQPKKRQPRRGGASRPGLFSGLLGSREIEKRVDERFPTWQEFASGKRPAGRGAEGDGERASLPPHRIYITSPLHGNFVFISMVMLGLALGYFRPELAPVLIYGAIGVVLVISLFFIFRDGLFLHIEALRLEQDSDMINRDNRGPVEDSGEEQGSRFLLGFGRKGRQRNVFRSRLLQVHYQNVLRTFEQGNRRAWVDQDASVHELHTLLSQRGMKLVWTMIEVLPQLGLLGTLIGLIRMFTAFRATISSPEIELLAGFGTALGTTVLANIFVLILRPLYMRNERSMNEVLTTIQSLMATFILPTQQSVLERTAMAGLGRSAMAMPLNPALASVASGGGASPLAAGEESRLARSISALTESMNEMTEAQHTVESGAVAKETAEIAQEVKETLRAFQDAVDLNHIERQQRAIDHLTHAVEGLAVNLNSTGGGASPVNGGEASKRIEHDLTQLRLLTHDTLVLLQQIAGQLETGGGGSRGKSRRLLSSNPEMRAKVFPEEKSPDSGRRGSGKGEKGPSKVRLFNEPV